MPLLRYECEVSSSHQTHFFKGILYCFNYSENELNSKNEYINKINVCYNKNIKNDQNQIVCP